MAARNVRRTGTSRRTLAILVDGDSEMGALPELYLKFQRDLRYAVRQPIKADLQPYAPIPQIALQCVRRLRLIEDDLRAAVVLLDRENRRECPGRIAIELANAIRGRMRLRVDVVVKDRRFENWLVADAETLCRCSNRFHLSGRVRRLLSSGDADSVDALAILEGAAIDGYNKVADSRLILRQASVMAMANHSRSFRRFLRVLGYPSYISQSRDPCSPRGRKAQSG
jgi:Domain of unknown function (DUF4276)